MQGMAKSSRNYYLVTGGHSAGKPMLRSKMGSCFIRGNAIMKFAAVQIEAVFADVEANLIKAENKIDEAVNLGAEVIVLPEFFTSAIGFSPNMLDVAIMNDDLPMRLIKSKAQQHRVVIGGSNIQFNGEHAYNTFVLTFPNGDTYYHNKDIPTQLENCYYTDGNDCGILETPIGNIGVTLCWEMLRYDTIRRLYGKVDFILAGSCWWDLPEDAPVQRNELRQYNQMLALGTPVEISRLLEVPVIHASHCGKVTAFNFPNMDKEQTRQLVGASQIIDNGNVVERREYTEGEGIVIADIDIDGHSKETNKFFGYRYWIPDLPDDYLNAWDKYNKLGREYYTNTAL
jgi:predicted amidohydrolase